MSTDNVVLDEYQNGSPPKPGPDANREQRSRSRSPASKQRIYESEGTNTTSDKPHLQRARLFVGNVDQRIHRSELRRIFARYGEVMGVSVHKGFAFVQMDRERHANNAILGEDNRMLNGSRLHVEFSQAAKKAGARFEEESLEHGRGRSPPRGRGPGGRDPFTSDLDEREAKLARVLAMEKELAYYRSQESNYPPRRPPGGDYYDRHSPPRDYDRGPGGFDRRDFYDRQSPPISPKSGPSGGYRDPYPPKRQSGYDSRDSGYGRGGEPSVGYGGSSGRMSGGKSSNGPPPGWPSTGFSKSTPNQRPFSNSGPWN